MDDLQVSRYQTEKSWLLENMRSQESRLVLFYSSVVFAVLGITSGPLLPGINLWEMVNLVDT